MVLYWSWLRSVCRTSRPGRHRHPFERIDREIGFPCAGGEFAGVPGAVRQLEAVGCAHPGVVVGAAWHHRGDRVSDRVVVVVEPLPRHRVFGAEQFARQLADDGDFAAHLVARRVQAAAGQVHHRHRILHGDLLFRAVLHVTVGAAERGQDERGAAVHDVAAVQLRRHLHGQRATAQCCLGDRGVRRRKREVAAHAHEHLGAAVAHRPDRIDGVHAVLARADDTEVGVKCGQERLRHLLPDAHRAVALHVRMPAHRAQSGSGFADHAAHQQHVG